MPLITIMAAMTAFLSSLILGMISTQEFASIHLFNSRLILVQGLEGEY
jgi:hypothetical protein